MLADGQAPLCWQSKQVTNWKKQYAGRRKLNITYVLKGQRKRIVNMEQDIEKDEHLEN